jgi:hypothetical protein
MLNVGGWEGVPDEWYHEGVREFFSKVAVDLKSRKPLHGRLRHLVVLPIVGIGRGGLAEKAGTAVMHLLPVLYKLANVYGLDVALAAPEPGSFAAAQAARHKLLHAKVVTENQAWPQELSMDRRAKADELARYASQGKLALFLGAGVSTSAGLPDWKGLLDQVARRAGMTHEWKEVKQLDVSLLDQPVIIQRWLEHKKGAGKQQKTLGALVSLLLKSHYRHSLTHGLLAGLPVREVVTTNYDQLFEDAWTETREGEEEKPPVIPYQIGPNLHRWLLKLHGSVEYPDDIVLTREDFLRYTEQRGALTGIVQSLLITRHLLLVGFSLDDPNFYEIVDAVRRVLKRKKDKQEDKLGTALMTERKRPVQVLWTDELNWLSTSEADKYTPEAGRVQEIFLDYLSSHVRDASRLHHLLNDRFKGVLDEDERKLAETLQNLGAEIPQKVQRSPAWQQVVDWLSELGYHWEEKQ